MDSLFVMMLLSITYVDKMIGVHGTVGRLLCHPGMDAFVCIHCYVVDTTACVDAGIGLLSWFALNMTMEQSL